MSKEDKELQKLLNKKTLTSKEAVRLLELIKLNGNKKTGSSHQHFKGKNIKGKITVPAHSKELKVKTKNSILKQAGLK
ncbi:MAG: type II toxin-antitoxin system HicA family toxin [Synergistaceae bacterium]|nr:type II toxin-antitoxin system HicA family toxin [Synergistaceae bacterium]